MLEVSAALSIILDRIDALGPETVPVSPAILDRVIATSVAADRDSPPFAKSLMDGYAVRSADVAGPARLTVIEEVAAGRTPTKSVGAGQAIRIMTGAPIPDGADVVIPFEETELLDGEVRFHQAAIAGKFILPRGREMTAGEVIIPAGTTAHPVTLGLLAAVGCTEVQVVARPRVAILSTGDELVEPHEQAGAGQIRNSNGPMLRALAERSGTDCRYLGIARDDQAILTRMVRDGLDWADVLILSGGVSAGKFDFVPGVLREQGVESHFHKVRMKPGKPLLFGTRGRTLVFGLPGNPVSSFVTFQLFVRPAIRKLGGQARCGPEFVPMPLAAEFVDNNDRPTYAPATVEAGEDGFFVRPRPWFGSADLRGLLLANALVSLPAGAVSHPAGTKLPTLLYHK